MFCDVFNLNFARYSKYVLQYCDWAMLNRTLKHLPENNSSDL